MSRFDLALLESEILKFVEERDWDQFHSVKNLAMALSVESSELVEIFQWMKEQDSNQVHQDASIHNKVQDELADILFFVIRIAQKTNTNLEQALLQKLVKNREKYPAQKVRGSSKKYSDYE
jgi:dCTP diphosphatase